MANDVAQDADPAPVVDGEMRMAYAAALWQFHEAQSLVQDEDAEPQQCDDQRSLVHRILDVRRWRISKPSRKTCYSFGIGYVWGIFFAIWWGHDIMPKALVAGVRGLRLGLESEPLGRQVGICVV